MSSNSNKNELADILKRKHLRITVPRLEILRVLKASSKPVTVFEIHSKLQTQNIDLATVYRTVNSFLEKHMLTDVDFKDEFKRYELTIDRHHHHHIVCKQCGKVENVDFCMTDEMETEVKKMGYKDVSHSLEFFGVCNTCQNSPN